MSTLSSLTTRQLIEVCERACFQRANVRRKYGAYSTEHNKARAIHKKALAALNAR